MNIIGNRVLVSKIEPEKKEGFTTVEVQDSFLYKGKIEQLPVGYQGGNITLNTGDIIMFAKYSPDTQEVDIEGAKMKMVMIADILAVL